MFQWTVCLNCPGRLYIHMCNTRQTVLPNVTKYILINEQLLLRQNTVVVRENAIMYIYKCIYSYIRVSRQHTTINHPRAFHIWALIRRHRPSPLSGNVVSYWISSFTGSNSPCYYCFLVILISSIRLALVA